LAIVRVEAEKMKMNFLVIGKGGNEENSGRMASIVLAAREINERDFFDAEMDALFGDCEPDITVHLRDHEKNVNLAAGFVIAESADNTCSCSDEDASEESPPKMLGIMNDYSSISIGVSPVATVFGLPMVSYSATSPQVVQAVLPLDHVFYVCPQLVHYIHICT
jgi:hypothetical protein